MSSDKRQQKALLAMSLYDNKALFNICKNCKDRQYSKGSIYITYLQHFGWPLPWSFRGIWGGGGAASRRCPPCRGPIWAAPPPWPPSWPPRPSSSTRTPRPTSPSRSGCAPVALSERGVKGKAWRRFIWCDHLLNFEKYISPKLFSNSDASLLSLLFSQFCSHDVTVYDRHPCAISISDYHLPPFNPIS